MDRKLHLLESFDAHGSDGSTYKVLGFEHLVRDPSSPLEQERWEPTGTAEYRLADGRHVSQTADGVLHVAGTPVTLSR
ncbi:hypothetical protein ACVNIS_17190 [Sphaerotilaceae bacterium SBD11-9]